MIDQIAYHLDLYIDQSIIKDFNTPMSLIEAIATVDENLKLIYN